MTNDSVTGIVRRLREAEAKIGEIEGKMSALFLAVEDLIQIQQDLYHTRAQMQGRLRMDAEKLQKRFFQK